MLKNSNTNDVRFKEITVKANLPEKLNILNELAHNLYWSWNQDVIDMFSSIDPILFNKSNRNPVLFLSKINQYHINRILGDKEMLDNIQNVYDRFKEYMSEPVDNSRPSVAYFCMEYGLSQVLKIYSGGLGVLAGDYLKEASDSNVNMCAIGFLYRYGYFTQSISPDGQQIANYDAQNFNMLPIERQLDSNGKPMIVDVPYLDYYVHAYVWRVNVGRISLYLLDTDNELNSEFDKRITHSLYGGDWENRLKQEILLGIGGMLTLKKLGIKKNVYHCNEGHAALCNVQRLVDYIDNGLSFDEALEIVRASSLYTVHTPVPAGHDYFDEELFGKYMRGYSKLLNISWDDFIGMGRTNPDDKNEKFCMSTFACNTCQAVNGVSWLHGEVSKKMFSGIWKGRLAEESHVSYVTNGVHFPTWCAPEWRTLYAKYFADGHIKDQSNENYWEPIHDVPNVEIWNTHMSCKEKLIRHIGHNINPDTLIIGFGRRFATYKRAHLLFTDLERLKKIVNNKECPVTFLYTGKAHPADGAGQGLIKKIHDISKMDDFKGKVIFLENYDMDLAKKLISGVDIWLNTPTRPMEASGTSGEKALMNGVVNFSVLDGWWYEGYREGAGWALTDKRTYTEQGLQDKLDAETIYDMLEEEIVPAYYDVNDDGVSSRENWIGIMKNSISMIAPHYTMKRQLDDYYYKFYCSLVERSKSLLVDEYAKTKEIVEWKKKVADKWSGVEVIDVNYSFDTELDCTKKYVIDAKIKLNGLEDDVVVECLVICSDNSIDGRRFELITNQETGITACRLEFDLPFAGEYKIACRVNAYSGLLPHINDFCYSKWF